MFKKRKIKPTWEVKKEPKRDDVTYQYDLWGDSMIRFMKSKFFVIVLTVLLTILQTAHPAKILIKVSVFHDYSDSLNIIYSALLAFLIEFMILYYVLKENKNRGAFNMSLLFMFFSILINTYFYMSSLCIVDNQFIFNHLIIPSIGFSIVIPCAIYKVSEQLNVYGQKK